MILITLGGSVIKKSLQNGIILLILLLLLYSFYRSSSWLELCAGLAFFLFGMQCMQDGLQQLAGGKLERILAKSTETPLKSLLFGISSTLILQSTTVVSLLIIAFISTNLITLAAGIGIIIGANVGSSGGIWLLALAGQNVSLSPFAYPIIVIGILASFFGKQAKSAGRVLLGVAFILLAIDLIKGGFSAFTEDFDILSYALSGWFGLILLVLVGIVLTIILQSSHATLMLILTMLSLKQIDTTQSFALTIGAIIGSAMATGILGFLGGNRAGMRVAASHVIYNAGTGIIVLLLLKPLIFLINIINSGLGFNPLIQVALFYTLFNIIGLLLFWPLKTKLAHFLERLIPNIPEPEQLIEKQIPNSKISHIEESIPSPFLTESALSSTQTATQAVLQDLQLLSRVTLEVICHILLLKTSILTSKNVDDTIIIDHQDLNPLDADELYRQQIKSRYSELLTFISKIDYNEADKAYQGVIMTSQLIAFKLVSAVKNSHHLQKNLRYYLLKENHPAQPLYLELRNYIVSNLQMAYWIQTEITNIKTDMTEQDNRNNDHDEPRFDHHSLTDFIDHSRNFESQFRNKIYQALKENILDGFNTSSLLNDLEYATQIVESLFNILKLVAIQDNNLLHNIDKIMQMNEQNL